MRKLKGSLKPLTFVFQQMKYYPLLTVLAAITLLITTGTNMAIPYLTKPIINDAILTGDVAKLMQLLTILAVVYVFNVLSSYLNGRILVRLAQKVSHRLRSQVFLKMQDLPMSFFDGHTHGELMSAYTNDIDTISNFVSSSVSSLVSAIFTFFGIMAILLYMNPLLTLVSLVFLGAQYVVMKKSGGMSRKYFVTQQAELAAMNGYIEEMTEGQKVIKVFSHEEDAVEGFDQLNDRLLHASYTAQVYGGIINPALGGIAEINNAMTCTVGVVMAIFGVFDIGSLVSFITYVQKAGHQIGALANLINMILAAVAGSERVMAILEMPSEVDEGKITAEKGKWSNGTPVTGNVEFRHMSFGYTPDRQILKDISFTAQPGKKIAFVGSTGAGKTTMTNLVNRFYEVGPGQIFYDGIDINDIKKNDLRGTLSMVLQDTHLFTGTVRENIRFGRLDATDEEVEAAAKLANADFFIRHLPQGYDTMLTADGGSLSQGQRQLLAIARAAVADPTVLVLDEATSSIDTRTEKLIELGMNRLMEGRTVFIIAHRLSTVRDCDTILVLEHGEIIERGTHDQLLAMKGRYYDLYTGKVELD